MLELLDLRTRRERLEPRRLEIDPPVADTLRGLGQRVRAEGGVVTMASSTPATTAGTTVIATDEGYTARPPGT